MEELSSEDKGFLKEFVGKNVKIQFNQERNIGSFKIIGFGKKFIKALDGSKSVLININDISYIREK